MRQLASLRACGSLHQRYILFLWGALCHRFSPLGATRHNERSRFRQYATRGAPVNRGLDAMGWSTMKPCAHERTYFGDRGRDLPGRSTSTYKMRGPGVSAAAPTAAATAPQCLRMTRNQSHCRDQNDEETLKKWVACAESAVEFFANGQVRLSGRAKSRFFSLHLW